MISLSLTLPSSRTTMVQRNPEKNTQDTQYWEYQKGRLTGANVPAKSLVFIAGQVTFMDITTVSGRSSPLAEPTTIPDAATGNSGTFYDRATTQATNEEEMHIDKDKKIGALVSTSLPLGRSLREALCVHLNELLLFTCM